MCSARWRAIIVLGRTGPGIAPVAFARVLELETFVFAWSVASATKEKMFERVLRDVARCELGERGKSSSRRRTCWYHHDRATRGPSLPQRWRIGSNVCRMSSRGASRAVGDCASKSNVKIQLFSVYNSFLSKLSTMGVLSLLKFSLLSSGTNQYCGHWAA